MALLRQNYHLTVRAVSRVYESLPVSAHRGKNSSHVDAVAPVVGDPATNYYYTLRTLNCAGNSTADSAGVAEFDYALIAGQ
mgnify:CR=1 FL=1